MIHIKRITPEEMNGALRRYFDVASAEDFWEVKGMYAKEGDLCYSTLDDNCYYYFEGDNNNFVYFAMEPGKMENIKGMWECFYDIVCTGYPLIRINGRKGRYPKLLKSFGYYKFVETPIKENEEVVWYIGHPENIDKIRRRFN